MLINQSSPEAEETWAPIPELRAPLTSKEQMVQLIQGGNAVLTVVSKRTGDRYTFRFGRPSETDPRWVGKVRPIWCNIRGGPDSQKNWTWLGTLWPNESQEWFFSFSRKSKAPTNHPAALFLTWLSQRLPGNAQAVWERTEWWHEGRCGRCGRRLTDPQSIRLGFGPTCDTIVGSK